MRAALVIAARILRQRLRDRSAILFAVVTPLALAVAFAAIIPDFSPTFHTTIAVVDQDGGRLGTVLREDVLGHLVESGLADIRPVADSAAAQADVDAGRAGVAIVIPAGFSDAVATDRPTEIRILAGGDVTAREVARAVVTGFADDIGAVQLAVLTDAATGGEPDATAVGGSDRRHPGAQPDRRRGRGGR